MTLRPEPVVSILFSVQMNEAISVLSARLIYASQASERQAINIKYSILEVVACPEAQFNTSLYMQWAFTMNIRALIEISMSPFSFKILKIGEGSIISKGVTTLKHSGVHTTTAQ